MRIAEDYGKDRVQLKREDAWMVQRSWRIQQQELKTKKKEKKELQI